MSTGFVGLVSNPKVLNPPLLREVAVDYVTEWFSREHVIALNPRDEHLKLFRQNVAVHGGGHNLVTDAHIAALAMEYDAEVH